MEKIHQIYDKIFKKILTLSEISVINLINGLFDTDYPTDREMLDFPEPKIIYFYATAGIPDEYELRLNFGTQGYFDYKVPVLKYMNTTPEELTQRKMIILIPFELMKLRDAIKKERSPENLEALKNLIQNDILYSININMELENITLSDAQKLKRLTHQLYKHIYAHYEEMEVLNEMTDESLILDIDIIEKRHEKELAEAVREAVAEVTVEKDKELVEVVAAKDKEIELLRQQIAQLKKR